MADSPPVRALILDLDGVLWRGQELLPGVGELFHLIESRSLRFCLASNNATLNLASVQERLAPVGARLAAGNLVTSAHAAAGYIRRHYKTPPSVFVIGEETLRQALVEAGCRLVEDADHAGAVVVGMDRDLTWRKLVEAGLAIANGAAFIGTNPDRTFPTERGLGPGNGAILAALETATGRSPVIAGKPEPPIFQEATSRLAVPPAETLVVGDRLETDIAGGRRVGMQTALLLTGVSSVADVTGQEIQPDWTFEDLPSLLQSLAHWVR
jgi:4-nitrophenyl phosphatase